MFNQTTQQTIAISTPPACPTYTTSSLVSSLVPNKKYTPVCASSARSFEFSSSVRGILNAIPSRQDTYEQVQSITTELIGVQESLELWLNTNQDQYIQQASDHMKQIKTKKEDLELIYNREKNK